MNARTNAKKTRTHAKKIRTKAGKPIPGSLAWLKAPGRGGLPRLQTLSWGRLHRVYLQGTPAVRRAIEREAHRLGFRPSVIMGLNAWS